MSTVRGRSEHEEQALFVGRVRAFLPDVFLFAIPNGGLRDERVAIRLKEEGVVAGIPDLFVPEPRGRWSGLFIEMKRRGGGTWSQAQVRIRNRLRKMGYRVELARGADAASALLDDYLSHPPRC